jgi:flagellar motor switch protein FliG
MTATLVSAPPTVVVPAAVPEPVDVLSGLSGFRKAAILMMQLGRTESAQVLGNLNDRELEELSAEIARMGEVSAEVSAAVLDEFAAMIVAGSVTTRGGMDNARALLVSSLGERRAAEILDRVAEHMVDLPFSFLQHSDPRQILSYIGEEHPQTIALVLAHVPAMLASQVLAGLAGDLRADVAHRIAVMDRTSPEVIRQIEASLHRRLSTLLAPNELSTVGGVQPLVDIINRADRSTEKMILEGIEQRDPALAEQIRARMFMFEDLINLDDRAVQLVCLRRRSRQDRPQHVRAGGRRPARRDRGARPRPPQRRRDRSGHRRARDSLAGRGGSDHDPPRRRGRVHCLSS